MLEGVRFVPRNDVEALRNAMDDKVCGIVLEPIQGEGGIQETRRNFCWPAASWPINIRPH